MAKPYEYVTDLFQRIREDISHIKHKLFTEKPKSESPENHLEYSIDASHVNNQSYEEASPPQGPVIHARLNLPETIAVNAATEERTKPWAEDRNFILQFAGVVVGGAVFVIYACQLGQMINSNRFNREALVSVQRAFVSLLAYATNRMPDPGDPNKGPHSWSITPMIENSGTTPALSVINSVHADLLLAEPGEQTFIGDNKQFAAMTLGPKANTGAQSITERESDIFGKDLGDLKHVSMDPTRPKKLFVWGWLAYRDIFNAPHVTEFCGEGATLEVTTDFQRAGLTLGNCTNHNCTDEYCEDYKTIEEFLPKRRQP